MTYPICRHFSLAEQVQIDLLEIFQVGKKALVKILAQLKCLFERSEPRYLLCILYIDDLIVFAQSIKPESFNFVIGGLKEIKFTKEDLKLELEEYEKEANELAEEDGDDFELNKPDEGTKLMID
jgi:protein SHQ1